MKKEPTAKSKIRITTKGLRNLIISYLDVAVGTCDFSQVETMEGLVDMVGSDILEELGLKELMQEYLDADDRHDDW